MIDNVSTLVAKKIVRKFEFRPIGESRLSLVKFTLGRPYLCSSLPGLSPKVNTGTDNLEIVTCVWFFWGHHVRMAQYWALDSCTWCVYVSVCPSVTLCVFSVFFLSPLQALTFAVCLCVSVACGASILCKYRGGSLLKSLPIGPRDEAPLRQNHRCSKITEAC